ncbi:MAG TPA: hypothetical protein VEH29_04035 [Acidimicrobiales bacterium]|nr:hypothetical protein [Acidimicrobiales bacterium]
MRASSPPGAPPADPDVAATLRLLHRRHGWNKVAITGIIAFFLGFGAYSQAVSQGTPPPSWFLFIVIVLAALAIVGIVAYVVDAARLRRRPPAVRAQAAQLFTHQPSQSRLHHYPPRHRLIWALRWLGMLLILGVAVLSVPAVFDGVAYLAGAGSKVTFDPTSYQTDCYVRGGCTTATDGIMEIGGAWVDATWPDVVPLDKPFQIRAPVWRWGLGEALISSDVIAVVAILVSLLMEAGGVLVVITMVRLARNWRRHRQQPTAPAFARSP